MDADLAREAARLYELPASEFTAARAARAKHLRPDRRELADAVAALPKPTAAAAAVNRLARDEPSEVRALVQAGKRLRTAQEQAVSGKGGDDLQGAVAEHREALDRVRREAPRLQLSATVLDRVTATLRAASVDPDQQPLLERGLLARELESSGFGLEGLTAPPSAPRKRRSAPTPKAAAEQKRLQEARDRLAEAKRERTAAERARREAASALDRAEQELARAEAAVREAEASVEQERKR